MPSISRDSVPRDHREFLGRGQLRLVAALDKVAHDVEILHVLAGGEFRRRGRHQASLGVDDVRSQAAAADFPQALESGIADRRPRRSCPRKRAVLHRGTDQENGARRFAFADHQRLSVVDAAVAGGGVSALQFALQESVGSDASGGNAFGIGIQQASRKRSRRRRRRSFRAGRAVPGIQYSCRQYRRRWRPGWRKTGSRASCAANARVARDRRPASASRCSATASRWSSGGPG